MGTDAETPQGAGPRIAVQAAPLDGAAILTPQRFRDDRGLFYESWNRRDFAEAIGGDVSFVQDNHSISHAGVLRGLHYQNPRPQAKLVACVAGAVWDVIVDLRKSSPTFGRSFGIELNAEGGTQMWVPEGFAHGLLALSDFTAVVYKTTDYYDADTEHALRWNDPSLGIKWPLGDTEPILSPKDAMAVGLAEAVVFE